MQFISVCTPEQGNQARCGPGATCLILGGVPTCHCIRDVATGAAMAGNPYRGCVWDMSGKWEMYYLDGDNERIYYDGIRNEPYVISIQRTDAVLKTRYITGTIFVVTPITSVAAGIFSRAFLDVNDNRSVIMEIAEGFVDEQGRALYFKSNLAQNSLTKVYPVRAFASDRVNLEGGWIKHDGSRVKLHDFHRLENYSMCVNPGFAYWYNDDGYAIPQLRLSTTLFLDETLPFEQAAFDTRSRFIQVGMFGSVALGGGHIVISSPADGRPLFSFRRVTEYPLPTVAPPAPSVIKLQGVAQVGAVHNAAISATSTDAPTMVNQIYAMPIATDRASYELPMRPVDQLLVRSRPPAELREEPLLPYPNQESEYIAISVDSEEYKYPDTDDTFSIAPPKSGTFGSAPLRVNALDNSFAVDQTLVTNVSSPKIILNSPARSTQENRTLDSALFTGSQRIKDLFARADRRLQAINGTYTLTQNYPSPYVGRPCSSDAWLDGTDSPTRRLREMDEKEFLRHLKASREDKKVPVGIYRANEEALDDEEEAPMRSLEDFVVPKATLQDLKKLLTPQHAPSIESVINTEAFERGRHDGSNALFEERRFFGLKLDNLSPYDWLWRASARRLANAENQRDEVLMKKVGKSSRQPRGRA